VLKLYLRNLPLYALKYFPLFFCIFLFILFSNFLGLMPFGFTVTSHIFFTAFIGFSAFLGLTIRAFVTYNVHFVKLYIVEGVPIYLLPLLFIIEVLSY
jgi:F-type H+-transporting ATPase subunit a